jgi:hypothetical protein
VPFDLVELFVRRLRQQNVFVRILGPNGKYESLLLNKVIFSMSKVVRIYCSVSIRDEDNVFLRIHPDLQRGMIVVEKLQGPHPAPEVIFQHKDQCHIIRFITHWIVARLDWQKTKLSNLDVYKLFVQTRQEQLEQKLKQLNDEAQYDRLMSAGKVQPASQAASAEF